MNRIEPSKIPEALVDIYPCRQTDDRCPADAGARGGGPLPERTATRSPVPAAGEGVSTVQVRIVTELEECQNIWLRHVPLEQLTDRWALRECFHRHYRRQPFFVVAEEAGELVGLLPLSWLPESGCFGYFPGEVWHGKTWLEQNRVLARDASVLVQMMRSLKEVGLHYHLRYLLATPSLQCQGEGIDEVGYLFYPSQFQFDLENYFELFSRKSTKAIRRRLEAFETRGVEVRLDRESDFELMIRMNLERYGTDSYFADQRFTRSFRDLMGLFLEEGTLRITTVIIEGEPAAVDFGTVFDGVYTLLGGGTNARFPDIAKYINLYHMRRACQESLEAVDFLCGEFHWKPMFHLSARPLYLLSNLESAPLTTSASTEWVPEPVAQRLGL